MKKISTRLHTAHLLMALTLVLLSCMASAQVNPYQYTINKMANGSKGAVSSAHPLASQVGLEILKKGGNAFDAAIATQLALAVVYPGAGNIGGGGFLVAYTNKGKAISIDYREKAPGSATRDMYLDKKGEVSKDATVGPKSAGIPGTVAGFWLAHQKFGKLPWAELVAPAIKLAKEAYNVVENMPQRDGYRFEQNITEQLSHTEDAREAQRAFAEKRKPVFKGR